MIERRTIKKSSFFVFFFDDVDILAYVRLDKKALKI
jgi:hypothetical protein